MKKSATIISLILAFLFIPKYVLAATSGLTINEIMYDLPGTDDKHEWVELYNTGSATIDLTDWKFNDGDGATNHGLNAPGKNGSRGSLTLPAGGYLLLAGDATQVASDLPNYTGAILDTVMSLSNTSATLKILDKDGNEITSASYNKDMGAAGNGKTLEWNGAILKESYIDGGTPGTSNSVLGAAPSTAPSPSTSPSSSAQPVSSAPANPLTSPVTENNYQYSQDVYLNEFMPYPAKDQKEWVELYNAGHETINLTGWQIDDEQNSTKPQVIPDGTKIKPSEFLVIELTKNILNNDGDTARLLWPDDQVIHSVAYQKAKQNIAYAHFTGGWLATDQPTPGAANKKSTQQNNVVSATQASDSETDNQISLTSAPTITARQDTALTDSADAVNQTQTIRSPTSNGLSANPISSPDSSDFPNENLSTTTPNLSANIQDAATGSNTKTILALSVIIIFSAFSAVGLASFRRRQTAKKEKEIS